MQRNAARRLFGVLLVMSLMTLLASIGCAGQRPTDIGITDGRLAACPSSPNCVSSDAADDDEHQIAALPLVGSAESGWSAAKTALLSLPRVEIVNEEPGYLHAECTSALIGYVDDLELHLRPEQQNIAVRSASRLGHSDLGANRARVEEIRVKLEADTP